MTDKYRQTAKGRIAPNGYRLCDPLTEGEQLTDNKKIIWVIGKPIGCGGFGEIYLCYDKSDPNRNCVMKLDNLNGPLFVEVHFFIRVSQEEKVQKFISSRSLDFLGFPKFIGWGIDNKKKSGYRFLVMERLGEELQNVLEKFRLSIRITCRIACRIIDVLEYIHEQGYIYGDIKAQNILRESKSSEQTKKRNPIKIKRTANDKSDLEIEDDKYYLIDYGLVERYIFQETHKPYESDKRRANNGTCEFRSRDAHIGVISRRSDIESLGYNIILWFYGRHPWANILKNAEQVHQKKIWAMNNIKDFLNEAFNDQSLSEESFDAKASSSKAKNASKKNIPAKTSPPNGLHKFFEEINTLSHDDKPNYVKLKSILNDIANSNSNLLHTITTNLSASNNNKQNTSNGLAVAAKRTIKKGKQRVEDVSFQEDAVDSPFFVKSTRALNAQTPLKSKSNQPLTNGVLKDAITVEDDSLENIEEDEYVSPKKTTKRKAIIKHTVASKNSNGTRAKRVVSQSIKKIQTPNSSKSSAKKVSNRTLRKRNNVEDDDTDLSDVEDDSIISVKSSSLNGNNHRRKYPRLSTPLIMTTPTEGDSPLFGPFVSDDSVKENQNLPNHSICSNNLSFVDSGDDDDDVSHHHLQKPRIYISNQRCSPRQPPPSSQISSMQNSFSSSIHKTSCSDSSITSIDEIDVKPIVNRKTATAKRQPKLKTKVTIKVNGVRNLNGKLNGHISSSTSSSTKSISTARKNRQTKLISSNNTHSQGDQTSNSSSSNLSKKQASSLASTPVVETAAMQRIRMLIQQKTKTTVKK